jgi:hypothetical protein
MVEWFHKEEKMEEIIFEFNWTFDENDPHWVIDSVKRDITVFAECSILEVKTPKPGSWTLTCRGTLENIISLVAQVPWGWRSSVTIDGKSMWLDELEVLAGGDPEQEPV